MALEKKFSVKINSKRCKGCGLCVEFCLKKDEKVLEISKKHNNMGYSFAQVSKEKYCIGCGNCFMVCPDCAIEIIKYDCYIRKAK